MKHVKTVSKTAPARANGIEDILGMIKDFFSSITDIFNKEA